MNFNTVNLTSVLPLLQCLMIISGRNEQELRETLVNRHLQCLDTDQLYECFEGELFPLCLHTFANDHPFFVALQYAWQAAPTPPTNLEKLRQFVQSKIDTRHKIDMLDFMMLCQLCRNNCILLMDPNNTDAVAREEDIVAFQWDKDVPHAWIFLLHSPTEIQLVYSC
jgi:hypothetical protein